MPVNTIAHLIGNTPLIKMNFPEIPEGVVLYGKLEGHNPGGSVKDRPAYNMIKEALTRGDITRNTHLVEATSGNTGIALAMVAAAFNLKITLIMPESATQERIDTMRALGATVVLTPAAGTIEFSREKAEEMVTKKGFFMLNQFANPDNYLAHYRTTGPEIWRDTAGRLTHFVSSMGTTGTIMGTSRFLKEKNPAINIIGVQPEAGERIPGIRKWSPDFVPAIYDPQRVDAIRHVNRKKAIHTMRRMAAECGVFAGLSSGGAMTIALELAQEVPAPATIVSIVCDRGDRYLSSGVFGA